MFKTTLALAVAGATLIAAPVMAEEQRRTVGVDYGDLDLSTAEGAAELDRRIDRAAREACGLDERPTGSNMSSRSSRECYREARTRLDAHFARLTSERNLGG